MKKIIDKSSSNLLIDDLLIKSEKKFIAILITFSQALLKKKIIALSRQKSSSGKNNLIFLFPTLLQDTRDQISSLKRNKASGPNTIPNNIFIPFKKAFPKPLRDMVSMSFNQGVFPNIQN